MDNYIVYFEKITNGTIEVEAENKEKAQDKAENDFVNNPGKVSWDRPSVDTRKIEIIS